MLEIITDNTMKQVVCRDGGPHGGSHHQDPWHKRNSGEESRAANIRLRLVQLFVTVLIWHLEGEKRDAASCGQISCDN